MELKYKPFQNMGKTYINKKGWSLKFEILNCKFQTLKVYYNEV